MAAVLETLRPAPGSGGLVGADPVFCAQVLDVDGVAVSLTVNGGLNEVVWCSPGVSERLEGLQFTLGEGPGPQAVATCATVLEPDLSRVPGDRWPGLLPDVTAMGVRAVFCFPLHIGGACLGVMTLQRAAPGALSQRALTDTLLLTGALTAVILEGGEQQEAIAAGENHSIFYGAAVHQATGMISVQAGVPLAQALLRLRAYAYRRGRTVAEVATDVVARRVHFRNDGDGPDAPGRRKD
ncbi:GAF and ANTAR domain-containing protein [Streptomyces sp. MST-110588]|uniref:GAF and ANTAR domain-containing protein n=1 Tax=Streptomyces sp. MST-110588 TaxID=2833628 RepID=UPI001F5CDD75|nr:GAF and ANTAR domain-containing protein [Streptomyces sp. MST-110588]